MAPPRHPESQPPEEDGVDGGGADGGGADGGGDDGGGDDGGGDDGVKNCPSRGESTTASTVRAKEGVLRKVEALEVVAKSGASASLAVAASVAVKYAIVE